MMGSRLSWLLLLAVLGAGLGACRDERPVTDEPAMAMPEGAAIEKTSELGPVRATVRLVPDKPTLGDPLQFTLEVTAEAGVKVEMPSFGEALGRFQIVQFVPREEVIGGKWHGSQTYMLQAPMSGKQRIPALRIEFVDERPGAAPAAGSDAGMAETQELLTEEIPIDVISVLPEGELSGELGQPRGRLDVSTGEHDVTWLLLWLGIGALVIAGAVLVVYELRGRNRHKARISAYDLAMERLGKLESRGLPAPEQADGWYVELSGIIRRYLEDRYSLRAPELTTEEFLQVARTSGVLSNEHRELLSAFLRGCDRVKFARHAPDDAESKQALESARSFLQETRLQAEPSSTQAAEPGSAQAEQSAKQDTAAGGQA